MCATSDVVVVFPFEPVMATSFPRRNRQASSISLHTGIPRARASSSAGRFAGTPGLTTIKSCSRNISASVRAERELHCPQRAAVRRVSGNLGFRLLVRGRHRGAVARAEKRHGQSPCARAPPPARACLADRIPVSPAYHPSYRPARPAVTSISKSSAKTARTPAPESRTAR